MDNNTLKLIKEYVDTKVSSNLSGLSAYQIAIKNGFQGTEVEWLASLKGEDGIPANISNKEDVSNKVTSLSASSTDTQYPSAKATYDAINARASFDSPALTGTPTAPTAAVGTNTTQIATTEFVQTALKPSVLIHIANLPVNTSITATMTLIGSNQEYSAQGTSDSSGFISLTLNYTGKYKITYNNSHIKSKSEFIMNSPGFYTIDANWSDFMTYTVIIDKTNANPETACTYADNAVNMTKGSSDWDNMAIFKDIRPCIFQNGEVQYYLNPNDWTQKYNSNQSSVLTGEDGDVMIEFPKFAYKIVSTNTTLTVSVSNDSFIIENDSDYTYDAFSRLEEGDLNYFYTGAFKGSIDGNGKLRSVIAAKPANNQTIAAFRSAARLNGQHYQQSTYAQLKAIQCLYLIKYCNRDGQAAIGKGVVRTSESYITGYNVISAGSASTSNSTLSSGMTFGTTSNNTTHMRLFGIEDFWGNIWEWVDGLTTDGSRNLITSWNNFSGESITATQISTSSGVISNKSGYVNNVIGNTAAGFMPIDFNGSSSTYWADRGYLYASCVLRFGGRWTNGDDAGPFFLSADYGASSANAIIGARLSYV